MTLTDGLLIVLILAVLYAIVILKKRIAQMDDLKRRVQAEKEEHEKMEREQMEEVEEINPPIAVLRVHPPSGNLNPKVLELESELDKIWELQPTGRNSVENEKKEKEIIGKMVDIFVKEADKKLVSEGWKPHRSGSK